MSSYPGAAPAYPGAGAPSGYPAAAPYVQTEPEAPKKLSVLGLVGLGLSAVGTILAFIPLIGFIGFILLGAASSSPHLALPEGEEVAGDRRLISPWSAASSAP